MPDDKGKDTLTLGHGAFYPDAKPRASDGAGLPPPSPLPEPPKPPGRAINLAELFDAVQSLKDEREQTIKDRARFKADMELHVQATVKGVLKDVRAAVENMQGDFNALRSELGKKLNAAYAIRMATCEDKLAATQRDFDKLERAVQASAQKAVEAAERALKANDALAQRQDLVDGDLKKLRVEVASIGAEFDDKLKTFKKELIEVVDDHLEAARRSKRH